MQSISQVQGSSIVTSSLCICRNDVHLHSLAYICRIYNNDYATLSRRHPLDTRIPNTTLHRPICDLGAAPPAPLKLHPLLPRSPRHDIRHGLPGAEAHRLERRRAKGEGGVNDTRPLHTRTICARIQPFTC